MYCKNWYKKPLEINKKTKEKIGIKPKNFGGKTRYTQCIILVFEICANFQLLFFWKNIFNIKLFSVILFRAKIFSQVKIEK